MVRSTLRILALLVVVLAAVGPSQAGNRIALVIGNANYANAPRLANPVNDSADVSASLERLGFVVDRRADLDSSAMRDALRDFGERAVDAEIALVFFAGHGMEVGGRNYLIPVDARLKSDRSLSFEAIDLDLVLTAVEGASGLRLVLLDACRNNPFGASMKVSSAKRSIGRGLVRVEPETGTLVGYSAKDGTTADDGDGRNSPYTSALLGHLEKPGLEVNFLFRKVRDRVMETTGGRQEPFTYGSLPSKEFYLVPPLPTFATPAPDTPVDTKKSAEAVELAYWETVKDSRSPALLRSYLSEYPSGSFAALATAMIGEIEAEEKAIEERRETSRPAAKSMEGEPAASDPKSADPPARKPSDARKGQRKPAAEKKATIRKPPVAESPPKRKKPKAQTASSTRSATSGTRERSRAGQGGFGGGGNGVLRNACRSGDQAACAKACRLGRPWARC